MTHPKEAVEAVARALWAEGAAFSETWEYDEKPIPQWLWIPATALLDRIAPMLVAEEREAAAKFIEKAATDSGLDPVSLQIRRFLRHEATGLRLGLHREATP